MRDRLQTNAVGQLYECGQRSIELLQMGNQLSDRHVCCRNGQNQKRSRTKRREETKGQTPAAAAPSVVSHQCAAPRRNPSSGAVHSLDDMAPRYCASFSAIFGSTSAGRHAGARHAITVASTEPVPPSVTTWVHGRAGARLILLRGSGTSRRRPRTLGWDGETPPAAGPRSRSRTAARAVPPGHWC